MVSAYKVRWLADDGSSAPEFTVLKKTDMARKCAPRLPVARPVIKSWLEGAATCEVIDFKGLPCIWRANQDLVDKYNLPTELPPAVVSVTAGSCVVCAHGAVMSQVQRLYQTQMSDAVVHK